MGRERLSMILVIMYVGVTLAMAPIPSLSGWRGHPLMAFWLGNLYHLVATAVGVVAALWWRDRILRRLGSPGNG